jgi:hypothetical protein
MRIDVFLTVATAIFAGTSNYCSWKAIRISPVTRDVWANKRLFNDLISTACLIGVAMHLLWTTI